MFMTEQEYRAADGISRSELWKISETPEKFKYAQDHPAEPTPALLFGQVVHKLVLDPGHFEDDFAICPEIDRRTKEGKAIWQDFISGVADRAIVPLADYNRATEMVTALKQTPFVQKLLEGTHERPLFWTDESTGELCKVRLDSYRFIGDKLIIVDYKTTNDASTDSFLRSAINYGYDFQAAMYVEAARQVLKKSDIDFVFIAQEKEPPYSVNILQADPLLILRGYDIFRTLLGIYHDCKMSDRWYGYLGRDDQINVLGLPAFLAKELE